MHFLPPEVIESLPSLSSPLFTLRSLLHSPFPPASIFIHAASNATLLQHFINAAFLGGPSRVDGEEAFGDGAQPHIQDLLPRFVFVDCAQLASQKALFGRVLNGLSGWGHGRWHAQLGGVLSWDGRQEGYTIVEREQTRGSEPLGARTRRKQWRVLWDYEGARDEVHAVKGLMRERKDESLSAFLDGIRAVFKLGKTDSESQSSSKAASRFIVFLNAERLPSLEHLAVGQHDGTLLATIMRLSELTGQPVVPLLASTTDWLLLRPQRGATEPAFMLEMPGFNRKDITAYIKTTFSPTTSSQQLTREQLAFLLASLLDLLQQTFEAYLGYEIDDYVWLVEKLWPEFVGDVERGDVEPGDIARLVALFKNSLTREIEQLSELRPLLVSKQEDPAAESSKDALCSSTRPGAVEKVQATPTKGTSFSTALAGSPSAGPSSFYSPTVTPSRRGRGGPSAQSSSATSLALSLPLLSRYVLIAAFLASSNPSRKDILMLAVNEDEHLASLRKKKKGGGTRKTPMRKSGTLGKDGTLKKEKLPQRLLGPKAFPVERLVSIVDCILPAELRHLSKSQDILQAIATLTALRLLIKTSAASALTGSSIGSSAVSPFDRLDGIKLKCSNLELETVEIIGRSIGFKVAERLWEAV